MPSSPAPLPLDPAALAAFQRAGAAILAQERGLTRSCRIRLAQAARSAGIAEHQIEDAIRTLGQAEPAAPPRADEQRFRERLRKDLSANTRAIIGPTAQTKIVGNAQRKFGLDQQRAEQILREVTAELGVTRITASDATDSLAAQIDHAVGSSTWLAREGWDRLRSAGTKWGLDLEVVDEMIDERLAANKTDDARRSSWTRATIVGTGGAVLATAVVVAGIFMARAMRDEGAPPAAVATSRTTSAPQPLSTPSWWDVDLSVAVASARSRHKAQSATMAGIAATPGSDRAAGYERLISAAGQPAADADFRAAIKPVVAGCLALETDEAAAQRLLEALVRLLPAVGSPPPADAKALDVSLWAADSLAGAASRRGIAAERKSQIEAALAGAIGLPSGLSGLDPKQRQQAFWQQTLVAAYEQLAAAASKQPAEVAAIYPALYERAKTAVEEEQLLEAEANFLAAALPHAGSSWKTYARAIGRCVSSPDLMPALRMVETLRRATDPGLIDHLSALLLVRSGAEPKSSAKKDVIAAVRKALGASSGSLSLADRWQQLTDEADTALAVPAPKDPTAAMRQALTLAHLTTLAQALAQGEAGLATFDAGIERLTAPENPRAGHAGSGASASETSAAAPLSRNQQRELAKSLELLAQRGAAGQRDRESGWRRLAAFAKETDDIPPAAAAQIAQATAKIDPAERGVALAAIKQAGRWKHLRLALADALLSPRTEPESQRELVETVTSEPVAGDASTADLRRILLSSVLKEMPGEEDHSNGEELQQLADSLAQTYRERAALVGVTPGELSSARKPSALLELLVAKLSHDHAARFAGHDRLQERLKAARYVADGDLRYTVSLQRILIEVSSEQIAARRPQRAAAARRLAAEAIAAAAGLSDALAQLHAHERALLQLWMLYAPET